MSTLKELIDQQVIGDRLFVSLAHHLGLVTDVALEMEKQAATAAAEAPPGAPPPEPLPRRLAVAGLIQETQARALLFAAGEFNVTEARDLCNVAKVYLQDARPDQDLSPVFARINAVLAELYAKSEAHAGHARYVGQLLVDRGLLEPAQVLQILMQQDETSAGTFQEAAPSLLPRIRLYLAHPERMGVADRTQQLGYRFQQRALHLLTLGGRVSASRMGLLLVGLLLAAGALLFISRPRPDPVRAGFEAGVRKELERPGGSTKTLRDFFVKSAERRLQNCFMNVKANLPSRAAEDLKELWTLLDLIQEYDPRMEQESLKHYQALQDLAARARRIRLEKAERVPPEQRRRMSDAAIEKLLTE